jgi:hypothetical protein
LAARAVIAIMLLMMQVANQAPGLFVVGNVMARLISWLMRWIEAIDDWRDDEWKR